MYQKRSNRVHTSLSLSLEREPFCTASLFFSGVQVQKVLCASALLKRTCIFVNSPLHPSASATTRKSCCHVH